jgi:adenine-specific DNA-methyltransferase
MRFIGNKTNLLENIRDVVAKNCGGDNEIFCDIFSGTGSVSRYFKNDYKIISNDILYCAHILSAATVEVNEAPKFEMLRLIGIDDPLTYLESATFASDNIKMAYCTENYSPAGNAGRMYLTEENAKRIDFIRETIEEWKDSNLISDIEHKYLVACLIESVPFVSNITGTYGAYLKTWDKRAFKRFDLVRLGVVNNGKENKTYNEDANALIRKIEGDILYIDPPYNDRQYLPNYHVLETIAKNDCPAITGVTGVRQYDGEKSDYCIKRKVSEAFSDLIEHARFTHLVISYSDDGLLSIDELTAILKRFCIADTVKIYKIPYARYKGKLEQEKTEHYEYIFYVRKDFERVSAAKPQLVERKGAKPSYIQIPPFEFVDISGADKKRFIKSPVNYIGGKYKLLPQLYDMFPQRVRTFVDLFAGGFNVAVNMNAERLICNDMNHKVVEMMRTLCYADVGVVLRRIEEKIAEYGLSKENEDGFKRFRDYYNKTGNPIDLLTLSSFSFNYQFRFNSNMEYNNPFGRDRSQFSDTMRKNLIAFMDAMKRKHVDFLTRDFRKVDTTDLGGDDFVYCDPPYLITNGSYNDGNRGFTDWGEQEERDICSYLDDADKRGVRFALSNVLVHKGKENKILTDWASRYNTHTVSSDYSNCNYQLKTKGVAETREVLITNY